jgi:hypothetical protein
MFGEKKFLNAALDGLLTAISRLEVGGWYARWQASERARAEEGAKRGEPSSVPSPPSLKGKDKVANPDWEDISFNPVSITPLSSKPRFAQVVGYPSKAMARIVVGAATVAGGMGPPDGGRGDGGRGGGNAARGLDGGGLGDGPPGGDSPSRSDGDGSGSH